jgi:Flp pilus assembly protein TadG
MLAAAWRSLAHRADPIAAAKALIPGEDGAAAVEFGLVAAPFVALLFALLQAIAVFFAGRLLDVAVTQSSRQILTGSAQTSNLTATGFAAAVCQNVYALFSCGKLMMDVEAYASFAAANTSAPILTFDSNGNVNNTWQFNPGGPNDIVVVRVMYQWPVFLGPLGLNLSNLSNGNRLLVGTAVFKNEPY